MEYGVKIVLNLMPLNADPLLASRKHSFLLLLFYGSSCHHQSCVVDILSSQMGKSKESNCKRMFAIQKPKTSIEYLIMRFIFKWIASNGCESFILCQLYFLKI
jgi:hypothetical protein